MAKEKIPGIVSYRLSPTELESLQKKYGLPGEMAPGQPAIKKRNRLHNGFGKQVKNDNNTPFNEEGEVEPAPKA